MMNEPQAEHAWLQQIVGEWTYEASCMMAPGQPWQTFTGTETVRSLGGLWVVLEGKGQMPDGGPAAMLMTLGFDPAAGRYVGTWVGSMMARLWVYDIARVGNALNMDAAGPSFDDPARRVMYRDIVTILDADTRTLSGNLRGEDGQYHAFMNTVYRRTA